MKDVLKENTFYIIVGVVLIVMIICGTIESMYKNTAPQVHVQQMETK